MKFNSLLTFGLTFLATLASLSVAQNLEAIDEEYQGECGFGRKCPPDRPCCNQFGECGTGSSCMNTCDVRHSYNISSCQLAPVCLSQQYTRFDPSIVIDQADYNADPAQAGWTTNGRIVFDDGAVLLAMPKGTGGSVMTSTRAVWYGKIRVLFKASHGQGVISAFLLMSGARDEIDFEFLGYSLKEAQTCYYYQGIPDYTAARNESMENTFLGYHSYELDWHPDHLIWSIDGVPVRTVARSDTYNSTYNKYMFPQTPSFVQFSIWPGGAQDNPQGTVEWAGGPINWNMKEFDDPGFLNVAIKEISIECYDSGHSGNSVAVASGPLYYQYTSDQATENDVRIVSLNDQANVQQPLPIEKPGNEQLPHSSPANSGVDQKMEAPRVTEVLGSPYISNSSPTAAPQQPPSGAAPESEMRSRENAVPENGSEQWPSNYQSYQEAMEPLPDYTSDSSSTPSSLESSEALEPKFSSPNGDKLQPQEPAENVQEVVEQDTISKNLTPLTSRIIGDSNSSIPIPVSTGAASSFLGAGLASLPAGSSSGWIRQAASSASWKIARPVAAAVAVFIALPMIIGT
uniref:ARAD1D06864p n=1 Tax=Blastobotrys adeninivorans TaxID=409370 RepID=A0A060T8Y8_BLAAD